MDSFKSTLARQKLQRSPQPNPVLQTGTQPMSIPSPPHAAPHTGTQPMNVPAPPYGVPQTGAQPMSMPMPPHAAPQTGTQQTNIPAPPHHAVPQASGHPLPIQPPRATSAMQPMMHSPAMNAPHPGQDPPSTQAVGNVSIPQNAEAPKSIFDVLEERQISFSNNHIRSMNFKAEMFTHDEAANLSLQSVHVHSDGVIRYHQQIRGEIRQTPLFIMEG